VPTMAAARISPTSPPHRVRRAASLAVAATACLALGGCGGANGPWARDGGVKAPPPIAEVRERPARQAAARPSPARWQLRPSDDGRGCRLTADAPGGTVTLLGGAGTEPETTPRIVLRIVGAGPQRFQPGRDYALRAANAGSALPLAGRGEREAAARVPTAEGGDRTTVADIVKARTLRISGPGLDVTLATAPDPGAARAFAGCLQTAAGSGPAHPTPSASTPSASTPSAPRTVVASTAAAAALRTGGAWDVLHRADACSIHRLDGPIGVSVASLRGAGLVITIHGRGAFEGGRRYGLRFVGTDGGSWTLPVSAVNANTLVWAVPTDGLGHTRVADLLRGGTMSVAELEGLAPTRLPPAGAAADDFFRCGEGAFGPPPPRAPQREAGPAPALATESGRI
jgi:hypothetical protein